MGPGNFASELHKGFWEFEALINYPRWSKPYAEFYGLQESLGTAGPAYINTELWFFFFPWCVELDPDST